MNVYLVGDKLDYLRAIEDAVPVENMEDADLVLFTGGSDIDPKLYDERPHRLTHMNIARDISEVQEFEKAQKLGKFCYGICRGAQLICALSGGKVIQHVTNHEIAQGHMVTIDGEDLLATSSHHQMMYPYTAGEYQILGVSSEIRSNEHWRNNDRQYVMLEEPEVVWFSNTRCLCVQPHPEWQVGTPFWTKTNELIKKYNNGL